MGDLRPLGSEKLQGMDKIRRIMEIARYNDVPKQENNELSTTNYTITLSDGKTYGIVKEKLGYIIKSGLNESTLDYTESMRHRKHYRSYSEAMKRLNIMAGEVNRVTGYEYGTPLIGEQAEGKKKFVLKQNKPKATDAPPADMGATTPPMDAGAPPAGGDMGAGTPPPMDAGAPPAGGDMGAEAPPPADAGAPPAGDMGAGTPPEGGTPPMDDMGADAPPMDDMGGEGMEPPMDDMGEPEDGEEPAGPSGLKSIQKLTGRLSQKIRSFDKDKGMDSQDIKYVVNSILSAINLENLDEDDRDDIMSKFDEVDEYDMGDEEIDMEGSEDLGMGEPDMGDDMMGSEMGGDMGAPPTPEKTEGYSHIMDSLFTESKVEKVLSGYFDIKPEEKPILEEKRKKDFLKEKLNRIEVKKEFVKLCESLSQLEAANEFYKEHKNAKFIGKTNKENLVFVVENRQYKVTPRGRII